MRRAVQAIPPWAEESDAAALEASIAASGASQGRITQTTRSSAAMDKMLKKRSSLLPLKVISPRVPSHIESRIQLNSLGSVGVASRGAATCAERARSANTPALYKSLLVSK